MSLNYLQPEEYLGAYEKCYIGYSQDESIRGEAASGGIVSAILINMLEKGSIQGALVTRQKMHQGEIGYETFIATTREEILDCRTSIYMDFPLAKHFKEILNFPGKVAVVALPCHLKALKKMEENDPALKEKIVMRISLYCSGSPKKELIKDVLLKNSVEIGDVERIFFRKGHWRGMTHLKMKDGSTREFSYLYNMCTYKNLYFDFLPKCYSCQDHFGVNSDISCGDVWLKEMKDNPIKHTGMVARNQKSVELIEAMKEERGVDATEVSGADIVRSQKRALIFKHSTMKARKRLADRHGIPCHPEKLGESKWNHYLAAYFVVANMKISSSSSWRKFAFKMPNKLMFLYMGLIRALLNF